MRLNIYTPFMGEDRLVKVEAEPSDDFEDVLKTVSNEIKRSLDDLGIDMMALSFYKPKNLARGPDLPERAKDCMTSWKKIRHSDFVKDEFGHQPDLGFIHLVLIQRREKRLLDEPGEIGTVRRTMVANRAPSTLSKEYTTMQKNQEERILDDAPAPDFDVAPVALLFDGFGLFLDTFRHYDGLPLVIGKDLLRPVFHLAVDDFAERMGRTYDNEKDRAAQGREALNNIFSTLGLNEAKFIVAVVHGQVTSDGHFWTERGSLAGIAEFKNLGTGITIPHVQLAGYAAHGINELIERKVQLPTLWQAPCLGIGIVDSCVSFYAILFLGGRIRVVSLTPWLSCFPSAGEGDQRQALYAAFAASSELLKCILADAKTPYLNRHASVFFPYISSLPSEGNPTVSFNFRITDRFADRRDSRLLYIAESRDKNDGKPFILKFARQYGIDLHRFCASKGHAPKVFGYDTLPGGWSVVAMELIDPAKHLDEIDDIPGLRDNLKDVLRDLVRSFHNEGLVHGDLRLPNILFNGQTVMLVDFDWGGKDGEASYPTIKLCDELRVGRAIDHLRIRKEDDLRILKKTLDGV